MNGNINDDLIRITNGTFAPFINEEDAKRIADMLNVHSSGGDNAIEFKVIPFSEDLENKINNINRMVENPFIHLPENNSKKYVLSMMDGKKGANEKNVIVMQNDAGNLVYGFGKTTSGTSKELSEIHDFITTSQNPFNPAATIFNVHGEKKIATKYMAKGINGYTEINYANYADIYESSRDIMLSIMAGNSTMVKTNLLKKITNHTLKNVPKRLSEATTYGAAITSPEGINLGAFRGIGISNDKINLKLFRDMFEGGVINENWIEEYVEGDGIESFNKAGFGQDIYKDIEFEAITDKNGVTRKYMNGEHVMRNIMKNVEVDNNSFFDVGFDKDDVLKNLSVTYGGNKYDLSHMSSLKKIIGQRQRFGEKIDQNSDEYNRRLQGAYSDSSESVISEINSKLMRLYSKGDKSKSFENFVTENETKGEITKKRYEWVSDVLLDIVEKNGGILNETQRKEFVENTRMFVLNKGLFDGLNNIQRQTVNTSGTKGDLFGTIYGAIKGNKMGQREAQGDSMTSKAVINFGGKNIYMSDIAQGWTANIDEYNYKKIKYRNAHAQELFNQSNEKYFGNNLISQFMSQRNMMLHVYTDAAFQDSNIVDATLALENTSMIEGNKPISIAFNSMNDSVLEGLDRNIVNEAFKNGLSNDNIYKEGSVEQTILRRLIGNEKFEQHLESVKSFEQDFMNIGKLYENVKSLQTDTDAYVLANDEAIKAYNAFFKKHGIKTGNDGVVKILDNTMVKSGVFGTLKGANYGLIEGFNFSATGVDINTKALWVHGDSVKFMVDEVKATTQATAGAIGVTTDSGVYVPVSGIINEKASSKKRSFAGTMLSRQLMTMGIHGSIFGDSEDYDTNFNSWKATMSRNSRAILEKRGIHGHDIFSLLNIDMNIKDGNIEFVNKTTMEVLANHKQFGDGSNDLANSRYAKIQSAVNKHFDQVFGKRLNEDNGSLLIGDTIFGTLDESYDGFLDEMTAGIEDSKKRDYVRSMASIFVDGDVYVSNVSGGQVVKSKLVRAERALKVYGNVHLMNETKKRSDMDALKIGRQGLIILSENGLNDFVDELEDKIVAQNKDDINELYAVSSLDGTKYEKGSDGFKQVFNDIVDLNDETLKYNVLGINQNMEDYMQKSPLSKILENHYDVNTGKVKKIKARIEGFDDSVAKKIANLDKNYIANFEKLSNHTFAGLLKLDGSDIEDEISKVGMEKRAKIISKSEEASKIELLNKKEVIRKNLMLAIGKSKNLNNDYNIEEAIYNKNLGYVGKSEGQYGLAGTHGFNKRLYNTLIENDEGSKKLILRNILSYNITDENKLIDKSKELFSILNSNLENKESLFYQTINSYTKELSSQYDFVQKALYTQSLALINPEISIKDFDVIKTGEMLQYEHLKRAKSVAKQMSMLEGYEDTGDTFLIGSINDLNGRNAYSLVDLKGIGKSGMLGFIIDDIDTDEFGHIISNQNHSSIEKIIKLNQDIKNKKNEVDLYTRMDNDYESLRSKLSKPKDKLELISKNGENENLRKKANALLDLFDTSGTKHTKFMYGSSLINSKSIDEKFDFLSQLSEESSDRLYNKLIKSFSETQNHGDNVLGLTKTGVSKSLYEYFGNLQKNDTKRWFAGSDGERYSVDVKTYGKDIKNKYEELKMFLNSTSGNDKWTAEYKGKQDAFNVLKEVVESHLMEESKIMDNGRELYLGILNEIKGMEKDELSNWLSNEENSKLIDKLSNINESISKEFQSSENKETKDRFKTLLKKSKESLSSLENKMMEAMVSRSSKLGEDYFKKGGKLYRNMSTSFAKSAEISSREGSIITTHIKNEIEEIINGKGSKENLKRHNEFFEALEKIYGKSYTDDIKNDYKVALKSKEIDAKKKFVNSLKLKLDSLSGIVLGDEQMYKQVNMYDSFGKSGVTYGLLGRNPHQYISSLGGNRFVMLNDKDKNKSFLKHMFGDANRISGSQSSLYFIGKRTAMAKHGDHDGDKYQMMMATLDDFIHKGKDKAQLLVYKNKNTFELLNLLSDYDLNRDLNSLLTQENQNLNNIEKRIVQLVRNIHADNNMTNSEAFEKIKDQYYNFKIELMRTNAELAEENEKHSLFANFRSLNKKLEGIKEGKFKVEDLAKDISNLTQDEKLKLFIRNIATEDIDNIDRFFKDGGVSPEVIKKIQTIKANKGSAIDVLSTMATELGHDKHLLKWNDMYLGELLRAAYTGIARTGGVHHALTAYRDATMRASSERFWNEMIGGVNKEAQSVMKVSKMYAPSASFGDLIESLAVSSKLNDGTDPYQYLENLKKTSSVDAFTDMSKSTVNFDKFYNVGEFLRTNLDKNYSSEKRKTLKEFSSYLGLSEQYTEAFRGFLKLESVDSSLEGISNKTMFKALANISSIAIKRQLDIKFAIDSVGNVGDSVNSFKSKFFKASTNFGLSIKAFFEDDSTDDIRHESWIRRFFKRTKDDSFTKIENAINKIDEAVENSEYVEVEQSAQSTSVAEAEKVVRTEPEPVKTKRFGRISEELEFEIKNLYESGDYSVGEIAEKTGVSKSTVYKRIKGYRENGNAVEMEITPDEQSINVSSGTVKELDIAPETKNEVPIVMKNNVSKEVVETPKPITVDPIVENKTETIIESKKMQQTSFDFDYPEISITEDNTNNSEIETLKSKISDLEAKLEQKDNEMYNEAKKAGEYNFNKNNEEFEKLNQRDSQRVQELREKDNLLNAKEKRIKFLENEIENKNKTIEGMKERGGKLREEISAQKKVFENELAALKGKTLGKYISSGKEKADGVFENVKKVVKENRKTTTAAVGMAIVGGFVSLLQRKRTVVDLDINDKQYESSQGSIYRNLGNYNINTNIRSFY